MGTDSTNSTVKVGTDSTNSVVKTENGWYLALMGSWCPGNTIPQSMKNRIRVIPFVSKWDDQSIDKNTSLKDLSK